ncbi:MAG: carbamoyltransferase [Rickettsiaceae bacterium]|jgi:carbamoyltransferase|nr:carbamoyltransferase [Rickettsiaceae bacterium]
MTYILGISSYYHDSAAALLKDGEIIAAAQEERFTRKKHDSAFPLQAIKYCLDEAKISLKDVEYIGFYDKPFLKFERLLETYLAEAPRGFRSFAMAIPTWLKEKLFLKDTLIKEFAKLQAGENSDKSELKKIKSEIENKLLFGEHHGSHAASCFYPSPFEDAAILTMDGVGEWVTTAISHGKNNKIEFLQEIHFPHSLGLLYSAITYFTGFKVNSGEYKVMGLAPYGEPKYVELIKEHLIDIKEDGSFRLNMKYFNYTVGLTMTNSNFDKLFGKKPRKSESEVTQFEMDLARSLQDVTEEVVIKLAKTARKITGSKNLVMSGGVALNCVANGKLLREKIFDNVWLQPASGDAGGALGVAQTIYFDHLNGSRKITPGKDSMKGSYLGKSYRDSEVKQYLDSIGAKYQHFNSETEFNDKLSDLLASEKVVGWHQGRMEFGPRALGTRSIIGDARSSKMQSIMNLKIKYRESFRPFAPAILREKITDYFEIDDVDSPYMLLVAPVKESKRKQMTKEQEKLFGIEKLNIARSEIPAVTHVDYSARIQTVHQDTNPRFHNLIKEFEKKTGCPVIINTSFNVRGEPIVCSPEDSYKCFMRTEMDVLAIENFILLKEEQPDFNDKENWQKTYELD